MSRLYEAQVRELNALELRLHIAKKSKMIHTDTSYRTFQRLVYEGLRPHHTVLDVGCGNLGVGKFLIEYLARERYYGVEPHKYLIEDGTRELVMGLVEAKKPQYILDHSFNLAGLFPCSFDFILMSSIWTHASHWQIKSLIETAARIVTRVGVIIANYNAEGEDYTGSKWSPAEVVHHSPECVISLSQKHWSYQDLDLDPDGNQWCILRATDE